MSEQNQETLIEDHRRALIMSGKLSKFHMDNLKAFPQIAFDNLDTCKLEYNFYRYGEEGEKEIYSGRVVYDLKLKEPKREESDLKQRAEFLKHWVQTLFWKDTKVQILREGAEWI